MALKAITCFEILLRRTIFVAFGDEFFKSLQVTQIELVYQNVPSMFMRKKYQTFHWKHYLARNMSNNPRTQEYIFIFYTKFVSRANKFNRCLIGQNYKRLVLDFGKI